LRKYQSFFGAVFKAMTNATACPTYLDLENLMPTIISEKNRNALNGLIQGYSALPWYKKQIYSRALSVAMASYNANPSCDSAFAISGAFLNET
jgi:hypothetical protein